MNLYVIRNSEGKFFRAKGYGGYGDTWVEDLMRARFYTKIGQAKSRITWFAREYPQYPAPHLLGWSPDPQHARTIDMTEYATKTTSRIAAQKLKEEKARNQRRLDDLHRKQTELQREIDTLKK